MPVMPRLSRIYILPMGNCKQFGYLPLVLFIHEIPFKGKPTTPRNSRNANNSENRKSSRKYWLVDKIVEKVKDEIKDFPDEEQVELMPSALKKLDLYDAIQLNKKPTKAGRKSIPLQLRKRIWNFWHTSSQQSTLTTHISKLRVSDKPKIQEGLDFVDSVTINKYRNCFFYESIKHTVTTTYRKLYTKFLLECKDEESVSWGTFNSLKPFYITSATEKDLEMCVCKKHLHGRWSIAALLENAVKQNIDTGDINDYYSLLEHLTKSCPPENGTYISWSCFENETQMCEDVRSRWEMLKAKFMEQDDGKTTVGLKQFEKVNHVTKKGLQYAQLEMTKSEATIADILKFMDGKIFQLIFHRNDLKHHRSTIHQLRDTLAEATLHVDLAENLTVPLKQSPQQLHWSKKQVTVHSAILKINGNKEYHPYLTEDMCHDQQLVGVNLKKLLNIAAESNPKLILVESDNGGDYKSSEHFHLVQEYCNEIGIPILRAYGTPEHCKHEVDHVGGIAKAALRRAIASDVFFADVGEMVEHLEEEFGDRNTPKYVVREISKREVDEKRQKASNFIYRTVKGTNTFRTILFKPNSSTIRASKRICICEKCMEDYGSCELFHEHYLQADPVKAPSRRSKAVMSSVSNRDSTDGSTNEFLLTDSVVAVAPSTKSTNPVWFMQINGQYVAEEDKIDKHGMLVNAGQEYLEGYWLEQHGENKKVLKFARNKEAVFLFKESVVYPFVTWTPGKKEGDINIDKLDYYKILVHVDENGMSSI